MKHFVLFYEYPADFRERRAAYRAAHIAYAQQSLARGALQLGGAFAEDDPPLGMLLFKAEQAGIAEDFARGDPYVLNGVVTAWRVREWVTVLGAEALTKI